MTDLEKKHRWAIEAIKEAFEGLEVSSEVKDCGRGLLVSVSDGHFINVINLTGNAPGWPQRIIDSEKEESANRNLLSLAIKELQQQFLDVSAARSGQGL